MRFFIRFILVVFCLMPLVGFSIDYEALKNQTKGSVYLVYPVNAKNRMYRQGSGVAISQDLLVTNCHVSQGAKYLVVSAGKKEKERYPARTVYSRPKLDLCVLRIRGAKFNAVKMRATKTLKAGERVFAIGSPKGNERFFSIGKIIRLEKHKGSLFAISDQVGDKGSSGGGLFDLNGKLVGIVSAMFLDKDHHMISQSVEPLMELLKTKLAEPLSKASNVVKTHLLGRYGKDRVQVYRANKSCFIVAKSTKPIGMRYSLFIWSPKHPSIAFLFPTAPTPTSALTEIADVFSGSTKAKFAKVDAILYLNKKPHDVLEVTKDADFYIAKLPKTTNALLKDSTKLRLEFNFADWTYATNAVDFGMKGFGKAVQQYRRSCR